MNDNQYEGFDIEDDDTEPDDIDLSNISLGTIMSLGIPTEDDDIYDRIRIAVNNVDYVIDVRDDNLQVYDYFNHTKIQKFESKEQLFYDFILPAQVVEINREKYGAGYLGGVDTIIWDKTKEEHGDYKRVGTIDKGVADITTEYQHKTPALEFALKMGANSFKHFQSENKYERANYDLELDILKINREKIKSLKSGKVSIPNITRNLTVDYLQKIIDKNIKNIANMASSGYFWAYEYRHSMRDLFPASAQEIIKEKWLDAGLVLSDVSYKHDEIINEVMNFGIYNQLNDFDEKSFLNNVPQKYKNIIIEGIKDELLEWDKDDRYYAICDIVENKLNYNIKDYFETQNEIDEDEWNKVLASTNTNQKMRQ